MKPRLAAAALFLCTAVIMVCTVLKGPDGFVGTTSGHRLADLAAGACPVIFLYACVMVFLRSRSGYVLGLLSGLIVLPWFVGTELAFCEGSWIFLNCGDCGMPGDRNYVPFLELRFLSVALVAVAMACSSLRLVPARWLLRNSPLCQRTWPSFVAAFLVMALWFVHSATPYRVPVIVDALQAEFPNPARGKARVALPGNWNQHISRRGILGLAE